MNDKYLRLVKGLQETQTVRSENTEERLKKKTKVYQQG